MKLPWWLLWPRYDDLMVDEQSPAACPLAVVAEQEHPRLRVWGVPYLTAAGYGAWRRTWRYHWRLTDPHGEVLDTGQAAAHPEALAIGLAALEQASARITA